MRSLALSIFLAIFVPDRPQPGAPPPIPDLENLQGTWQVVAFETPEMKLSPDDLKSYAKLIIKGNRYTWSSGGGGTFKIDSTKKPATIDYTEGPENSNRPVREAIYEVNGDMFRDCIAPAGRERPREFATPAGSGYIMLVYKRVP